MVREKPRSDKYNREMAGVMGEHHQRLLDPQSPTQRRQMVLQAERDSGVFLFYIGFNRSQLFSLVSVQDEGVADEQLCLLFDAQRHSGTHHLRLHPL